MLFAAFFSSFNPKFYSNGLNQILWKYVEQLEYPDAVFLRKITDEITKRLKKHSPNSRFKPASTKTSYSTTEFQINNNDLEYEFARRLSNAELVDLEEHDNGVVNVSPRLGLVKQLREFIWEDDEGVSS
jgi:inhibitor of KinA sporulation pathway (predicted exonuclease)